MQEKEENAMVQEIKSSDEIVSSTASRSFC